MKKVIKLNKKIISFFLAVIMIYSMVFTGIATSATTTDVNNGDWNAQNVTRQNTNEAQLMVRVGDIDNFGFNWNKDGKTIDPFSGVETAVHSFPFNPESSDSEGTDRIMVVSGYNYSSNYKLTGTNRDGYTEKTSRSSNSVRPIDITYSIGSISVRNATIQMFVDDFQPGNAKGVKQGNVIYTATINGQEVPELSNIINNLDESGPIGKLITFQIPERYLDLVRTGKISIKIDDSRSNRTGDGYAVDFVKLLINRTGFTNTATISGNVKDTSNNNIVGATVSAGGVVETLTDSNGDYMLNNVPAGQVVVTASKTGYNSQTYTEKTVIAGYGYTHNFVLTPSTPPTTPVISASPTMPTNGNVTATITYSSDSTIKQYRVNVGGVTGEWKVYDSNNKPSVTENCIIQAQGINQYGNESAIASYTVSNIDKEGPSLILSKNSIDGTITATATDNVAVASITKPDNTVVSGNSTTYPVSGDGTYTFKATDTAGNITTKNIVISNVPVINAEFESYTPNPAKSTDDITLKYNIKVDPFTLSSGMIEEAVVLEDMSQDMKNNQRWSMYQNGLCNQLLNYLGNSNISFGIVGYNDSVYVGGRKTYINEPKEQYIQRTDENLSNIDTTKFFPLFGLDNGNVKDGYRQFYQDNRYIWDNISNNDTRQFGTALKVADKVLTQYGTPDAKKAIIIISSGNLSYTDAEIENIKNKGYKIITVDVSNSNSTNIRDTHIKLSGNQSGTLDSYHKGTFNDGTNYNSTDADMRKVALDLKGEVSADTLSVKDAKLNIDLGENFEAANSSSGLEGSGRIRTVTIPEINFTKNADGNWVQAQPIEVTFKVKPASDKYGELGFGLYTNSDNSTYTNSSTISYTNYNGVLINKPIETPTIAVSNIDTEPPTLTLTPSTTNPTSGTVTITAAASDNVAVASITNPDESIVEFNPAIQNNSTTYIVSANGTYTFKATDTAGNVTTKSIPITNINRTGLISTIIDTINTKRTVSSSTVRLGDTVNADYTLNFNNQTLNDSKPNRQQWFACVKDSSSNTNYQSIENAINFKLNKNNPKLNETYSFSNNSSGSLSSSMTNALAAVTEKKSNGHERDIAIMVGTNISDAELQNAINVANSIKNYSDEYKLGINTIVINVGNKTGEENIKKLAAALGGNYMFLNSADEAVSKINNYYISQLAVNAANTADNYPIKQIYFEDKFSDNFQALSATQSFITIDNTNQKVSGSFYPNYYIEDGQIKYESVTFTVTYEAETYKELLNSYIGAGVFNVINNTTDQKILERVPIQVIVPDTTPPTITLTPSTTEQTKNNITVTANVTDNVGVTVTKWASGNQNSDYFASNGTDLNGNTFIVTENGTYTVYATDAAGNESVRTIRIDNIDREPPKIILTPSTTQLTKGNIIVTADVTDNVEVAITKWASGNQATDYFSSNGTVLSGSTFTVSENGIYTVYAKDTAGNESIKTITIDNIMKQEAVLNVRKELIGQAFVGEKFEIRYTITPNEIAAYPNDANPQELVVSSLAFNEFLPNGLILDQSQIDTNKLAVTLSGNTLSGNIVPTIRYTLDSTGTKYTAQPISFSIWLSSNSINTYTMLGENSYINYSDIDNSTKKANFNDLSIVVNGHSSILSHGIYSGKDSGIETSNNVVAGIPVTLAMKLDIESSNPVINWKRDNTVSEGTIVFKKYLLKDNGEIDTAESVQTLSFNNTGDINLAGLTTAIGKKYLITYTITPVSTGTITTTATADVTSSVPVNLNVGARPDLF